MKPTVQINGKLLSDEKVDLVVQMALMMFHRADRFLRDVSNWSEAQAKQHLACYLGAAEILHALDPKRYLFDSVEFENGKAKLKGNKKDIFGKTKKGK